MPVTQASVAISFDVVEHARRWFAPKDATTATATRRFPKKAKQGTRCATYTRSAMTYLYIHEQPYLLGGTLKPCGILVCCICMYVQARKKVVVRKKKSKKKEKAKQAALKLRERQRNHTIKLRRRNNTKVRDVSRSHVV